MSQIIIPDFKCNKQSSTGREERMKIIMDEIKKDPSYHFEGAAYTKERCSDLESIESTITHCLRMMHYAPQTRKDITEQILMELQII